MAKTAEEKQEWLEAILKERERRKGEGITLSRNIPPCHPWKKLDCLVLALCFLQPELQRN